MPRGPLPDPHSQRRNAATIPTTELPAGGREGDPPAVPAWEQLGAHGLAWWRWAWATPQAAAWSDGDVSIVAKRASVEDDLAALEAVAGLDFDEVGVEVAAVVRRIASLATGRAQLVRLAADLDRDLGLTPKAMAALRWKITDTKPAASTPTADRSGDVRSRFKVVGSAAG